MSLSLAPMEGVTEWPLRMAMRTVANSPATSTPFLRVTQTFPGTLPPAFIPELMMDGEPLPRVQLMASSTDDFCRTAEMFLKHVGSLELNCGCPSPTVVGSAAGSSLLRDQAVFDNFIRTIVSRIGADKFGVKIRVGFTSDAEFSGLLQVLASYPLASVAIHGRTRAQRYTGYSNTALIEQAAATLESPVWGSGDVCGAQSFHAASEIAPNVKHWLIGRGALRNPWVFQEIAEGKIQHKFLNELIAYLFIFARIDDGLRKIEKITPDILNKMKSESEKIWRECRNFGLTTWQKQSEDFTPRTFARIKMLWSYLRSGLPAPFMQPTLLRQQSLNAFLEAVVQLGMDHGSQLCDTLPLLHKAEHDWMYSGAARGHT